MAGSFAITGWCTSCFLSDSFFDIGVASSKTTTRPAKASSSTAEKASTGEVLDTLSNGRIVPVHKSTAVAEAQVRPRDSDATASCRVYPGPRESHGHVLLGLQPALVNPQFLGQYALPPFYILDEERSEFPLLCKVPRAERPVCQYRFLLRANQNAVNSVVLLCSYSSLRCFSLN